MLHTGYVVYNYGHKQSCIQSPCASLRVLGASASLPEAQKLIEAQAVQFPDLEVRISPFHQWRLLSKGPKSVEEQCEILEKRMPIYAESRIKAFQEVELRAAEKKELPEVTEIASIPPKANDSESRAIDSEKITNDGNNLQNVPEVPAMMQISHQTQVGIALLPDLDTPNADDAEPGFCFVCVADREDLVEKYFVEFSDHFLHEDHPDWGSMSSVPLICVSMYAFVRPTKMPSVRHIYRNEQMQALKEDLLSIVKKDEKDTRF